MSSQTTNLNLHKIDLTDAPPDITVLNQNWDILDTEVAKKASLDDNGKIPSAMLPELPSMDDYIPKTEKGVANGVATLGEDAKVPAKLLPEISSANSYSAVLYNYNWQESDDGRYYQTVSVPGVSADSEIVIVDVDLSTDDVDAKVAYLEAWKYPSANEVDQGDGTLTFYAWDYSTVNIPITVGVM